MNEVDEAWLRANPLPPLHGAVDKDGRGRVLLAGGGAEVPGGVMLAALAAMRAGAGKLQLATAAPVATGMALAIPEARVVPLPADDAGEIAPRAATRLAELAGRADAVAIGPGMMDAEGAAFLAGHVLGAVRDAVAFVLDAAALVALEPGATGRHGGRVVLTPHAGEAAALLDTTREAVEADKPGAAREAARRFHAVVAVKGAETVIASPQGACWRCSRGNAGLATSGSGDVLAGTVAGLLARGAPPVLAACWGVFLHARAGEALAARIGPVGYLAREIPGEYPGLMRDLAG